MIVQDNLTGEVGRAVRMVGAFKFHGVFHPPGTVVLIMPGRRVALQPQAFEGRYTKLSEDDDTSVDADVGARQGGAALMPHTPTTPSLPFQGSTVTSRHCSAQAAVTAADTRRWKSERYLAWLLKCGLRE